MSNTKEEILKPFIYKNVEAFGEAVTPDGALQAMDEHAKNTAIAFGNWLCENFEVDEYFEEDKPEWTPLPSIALELGLAIGHTYTTEQLYVLYPHVKK